MFFYTAENLQLKLSALSYSRFSLYFISYNIFHNSALSLYCLKKPMDKNGYILYSDRKI